MNAQITIFIILGIIIIAILAVGIFIYTPKETPKQRPKTDLAKALIQSCLQTTSKNALELLGSNGVIQQKDQGIHPNLDSTTSTVSPEGIVANYIKLQPAFTIAGPPERSNEPKTPDCGQRDAYPWAIFPINPNGGETHVMETAFGWPTAIPPIYKKSPINTYVPNSIQETLEEYTKKKIKECPLTTLPGITIITEEPEITVLLTPEGTDFILKWPMQIKDAAATTQAQDFVQHHDVKLKNLLERIRLLLREETRNLDFEISKQGGIKILPGATGTVVTLQDPNSKLGGNPYEYRFGIPNRAPVLWMIDQTRIDPMQPCTNTKIQGTKTRLTIKDVKERNAGTTAPCDKIIEFTITSKDPDEWNAINTLYEIQNGATSATLTYPLPGQTTDITSPRIEIIVKASDGRKTDSQLLALYNDQTTLCN